MYQAIKVSYRGPTNTRGARMVASCDGGRVTTVTTPYKHELNFEKNVAEAAYQLLLELNWTGDWHLGSLPGGDYCVVCVGDSPDIHIPTR
jgi:hypothetical protein